MERRNFIVKTGTGLLGVSLFPKESFSRLPGEKGLNWKKEKPDSQLFSQVVCDGDPFLRHSGAGILDARCNLTEQGKNQSGFTLGPGREWINENGLEATLHHRLHEAGNSPDENLLEASLKIRNIKNTVISIDLSFVTGVQVSEKIDEQQVYIPVSAAGLFRDERHAAMGSLEFITDCNHHAGKEYFECHYLEPMASNPFKRKTRALLLAPVVDTYYPGKSRRMALFTESGLPCEFISSQDAQQNPVWSAQRRIVLNPGESKTIKCFLLLHQGDSMAAWEAFHLFGHRDKLQVPAWLREVKVHYYDFLSSAYGENGLRGDGYEADLPFFKDYHVGLATQHGYYPSIGDFIQPSRTTWLAMKGDRSGPAVMSLQKMKDRIAATRKVGAHPAVYMHTLCFDDASPLFRRLKDSVMIGSDGDPVPYPWSNSDTAGKNWFMSFASKDWRDHLLDQTRHIMEILNPDAIVFDETFLCLGYDEHPGRNGPLSAWTIPFMQEMRELIHSYGNDKALLTSDCSMAGMVFWADGEAGDHSYPNLLGNPLYRKEPVRYLAPLCGKPWIPCSWHFIQMWEAQMDLARKSGTGIGVSNGYIEFNGLKNLPENIAAGIKRDIRSLF
jgi:hypothetical protein